MAALTAFTFSSCADVPEPYTQPQKPSSSETTTGEASGSGTLADPFNVAGAIKYIEDGGDTSAEVYVKGKVVSIKSGSYDSQYGSLKYYISDDGTSSNQFYVYNGYAGANRTKFASEDALKAGDEVVICGQLIEYSGTKEFQTGNYLVSLNGVATDGSSSTDTPTTGEAKGTGTAADPFNCAAAIKSISAMNADTNSDSEVYIKGIVVEIKENYGDSSYGNATYYIADDANGTSKFYVFRSLYLNNAKYESGDKLSVGDEVTVCGKVVYYKGNTPETVANSSYLYSHKSNGSSSETPDTPSTSEGLSISGTTVTLANNAVTDGESVTIDLSTLGYTDAQDVETITLEDGTVISFDKNGESNGPKYYTKTNGIRVYKNNKITFAGKSKIAKIIFSCDSYNGTNYVGNESATVVFSGNTATYTNTFSGTSGGGNQLRVKTIQIVYAK